MEVEQGPSKVFMYGVMLGMLLCGSANTLVQKYQNDTCADGNLFTHPYFQTLIMFSGELCVFGAYGVKKILYAQKAKQYPDNPKYLMSPGTAKAGEKQLKMNASPLLLAIPATCDFCGSTLMFIALTMVPASVYQMMRGFITVITAILSIAFLKRKQYRHHWVGLICIIVGVAEVGYVAIVYEGSGEGSNVPLGIALLLIAQLFTGSMFIVEEYFIGDYYLDPLKVVGIEGMWGCCYYIFLLPFMQMIKCSGTDGLNALCSFGYLENSAYAFQQMGDNKNIIWLSLAMMASIAVFNVCGINTTKVASAAQRSTIDTSRTLIIWIMSCALGLEDFQWPAIFGFILLVFGTLLYNEILVLPCMGFDQYTKEALASRAGKEKRDAAYMGTSPHAVYDASRNRRLLQKADDKHYDAVLEDTPRDDHELVNDSDTRDN